jgi:hypothetical protein
VHHITQDEAAAGIALEGRAGDNAVLDGFSGPRTDRDGTEELEDGA